MASWKEIAAEAPELAARAQGFLDAGVHKTMATLRKDGSPRISGTEARLFDGDLWFGSMANAMKARDLQRDPRFAIHSASASPPDWAGDAKVAGTAEEVIDPERAAEVFKGAWDQDSSDDSHLFRADITELVVVGLNDARDKMVIESWHAGRGVRRLER